MFSHPIIVDYSSLLKIPAIFWVLVLFLSVLSNQFLTTSDTDTTVLI
jgi:hypothetical protein